MTKPHGLTVRPWVLTFLAIVVVVVWAVNILAGLVVQGWQSNSGVNAVMAALIALIGAVGGKSLLARDNPLSSLLPGAGPDEPTTPEGDPASGPGDTK